jgi:DNA helicase-2/ATP-dependent DNA helicase PcrA
VKLSEAQERAVQSRAPILQILACAGSGKTEVLARRVARLLVEGEDPATIVAFTFTEKAAAELKSRIERRASEADAAFAELPPTSRGLFVGTIHSYCLRLLQELGSYEAYDALTEEREWALLHRVARRLGVVDLFHQLSGTDRVATGQAVSAFLRSAEVVYDERIDRKTLEERAPEFAAVMHRYERLLDGMRLVPFHLMIDRVCDLLAAGGQLRTLLQGRVRHVLVDEYQDLNRAQDEILAALLDMGATLTVVGDDDQAIYQWRGGDVELCLNFRRRYGSDQVTLGENRRSRPDIVHVSRVIAEQLPDRLPKEIRAARTETEPSVEFCKVDGTAEAEAEIIARRIERLAAAGYRYGDIAVLFRSVRTSGPPLVKALRQCGIPHHVVGRLSILTRPEMALVARIFVLWAGGSWYPGDERRVEIVTPQRLTEEIVELTERSQGEAERVVADLERMGRQIRSEGVWDIIAVYNDVLRLLAFPDDQDAMRRDMGLGRMSEILADFDHAARRAIPVAALDTPPGAGAEEASEDTAIDPDGPAVAAAEAVARSPTVGSSGEIYLGRLRCYLEEFGSRAAEEQPEGPVEDVDAVHIMTVHQAKGLEFPVVFAPALIEGRFPSCLTGQAQRWYVPTDMFCPERYEGRQEDEKRLFYVTLTRARELLVLSFFSQHRATSARPSPFLTEISSAVASVAVQFGNALPAPVVQTNSEQAPIEVDFSGLSTYGECGFRYWLREVCGFQPPLVRELGFGRFLHHAIAELARRGASGCQPTVYDVDEILSEFYLPFAGPIPFRKLFASARRRLAAYVSRYGEELTMTIQPEMRFEVPAAGARIRGRIDLLLRANTGGDNDVVLLDFKTAANRPPSEMHENQLRLYAEACRRLGLRPVQLAIHDLDSEKGGRFAVEQDARQTEVFRERLSDWVAGIRDRRFQPRAEPSHCQPCDYRTFCRHYRDGC